MAERFDKHVLKNGMVILGEPMDAVGSADVAFNGWLSRMPVP